MEKQSRHPLLQWTKTEIGFFFVFFFLLGFVQDIQYFRHPDLERQNWNTVLYSLVAHCFTVIPYAIYYKLLAPILIRKSYLRFILLLLPWIFLFDWYNRFMDLCIAYAPFLPDQVRGYGNRSLLHNMGVFGRQSVMLTLQNLTCVTALAYWKQSRDQQEKLSQLRQQQLQLQLDNLKAQLHPHFFFNTLNNIYSLALKQSADTAPTVAQLSDLMRYILQQGAQASMPLKEEIRFLRDYIALERIRHRRADQVRFTVQGNMEGIGIPPLLFLPFVENAFKHGLETDTNGFAEILVLYADGQLTLSIKNNYRPFGGERPYKGGIGISNVRQRLELIYPGKHELLISDQDQLFSVSLHIQTGTA